MTTGGRHAEHQTDERRGPFHDPLADWTNDDVLQTKAARAALRARHPGAVRVLDWPELRAQFARYDPPATQHGRRDRRIGLLSVGLAASGLVLAMLSPLAIGAEQAVEIMAVALVVAGLALMAFHRLGAVSKASTLGQRFGAERVRALYFQAVVNNPGLAARAMADETALGEWKVTRAAMLSHLPAPEDLPGQIPSLAEAVKDDAEAWVLPRWSTPPSPPDPSAELDLLLSLLRGQRLDGQIDYVEHKLSASLGAPAQRAALVRALSLMLVAAAVMTGVGAGVLVAMLGRTLASPDVKLALEVAVGALVAAMALRVVNDGRLLAGDAKRYAAYFAALTKARARFDTGGVAGKLDALREVEIVCYRDLRQFVGDHWRSR